MEPTPTTSPDWLFARADAARRAAAALRAQSAAIRAGSGELVEFPAALERSVVHPARTRQDADGARPAARHGRPMHVLVAYASKHGSTAEIAHAVTDTLRRSGLHA